jgi:hypothetical protein
VDLLVTAFEYIQDKAEQAFLQTLPLRQALRLTFLESVETVARAIRARTRLRTMQAFHIKADVKTRVTVHDR